MSVLQTRNPISGIYPIEVKGCVYSYVCKALFPARNCQGIDEWVGASTPWSLVWPQDEWVRKRRKIKYRKGDWYVSFCTFKKPSGVYVCVWVCVCVYNWHEYGNTDGNGLRWERESFVRCGKEKAEQGIDKKGERKDHTDKCLDLLWMYYKFLFLFFFLGSLFLL